MNLPEAMDLRITGACNLRCPFCFGPRHDLGHRSTSTLIEIVDKFASHGVRNIVFSGGEPLLVKELPLLLKEAKKSGLRTVLSTNGLLLGDRIDEVAPYLDWIGLPINGVSSQSLNSMNKNNLNHPSIIFNLMSLIRKKYPHIRIRLNTVVCAINKNELPDIATRINENTSPDVWKIFQVMYSSYAADNIQILELSDGEFGSLTNEIKQLCSDYGIQVTFSLRRERDGKYLFCEPNGDAVVISQGKEQVIGNFISDFSKVLSSWGNAIDLERLKSNFNISYPLESSQTKL